uniref:Uncharacterized protein n=1 Tax=Entomoneis paludosa TaxID=265537 RepID=A0A7S3DY76_9STRA|mmetsp:Transcript_782/g.1874  ORF Transcript_782/g.1874 Transcript_782/m.1874 type:complete len:371 (+) Transcript_782:37-1149(+)
MTASSNSNNNDDGDLNRTPSVVESMIQNGATGATSVNNNHVHHQPIRNNDPRGLAHRIPEDVVKDGRTLVGTAWRDGMLQLFLRQFRDTYWNNNKKSNTTATAGGDRISSSPRLYQRESELLDHHWQQPLYQGTNLSLLTFGCFRMASSAWFQKFKAIYFGHVWEPMVEDIQETQSWKKYTKNQAETLQKQQASKSWLNINTSPWFRQWKTWFPHGNLTLDVILSIGMGASLTLVLYNSQAYTQVLTQAPLLPGKSRVAETLCPPIVQAVQQLQTQHNINVRHDKATVQQLQYQTKQATGDQHTFYATHVLVHNCLLRDTYWKQQERRRRQMVEQSSSSTVDEDDSWARHLHQERQDGVVPYPGIKGRSW